MIEDTTTKATEGTDHREGSADYAWIVAQLAEGWRLIECRDGLQWIVQKGRRNAGEIRWYSRLHFRSKAGLLQRIGKLEGREGLVLTAAAQAALANLPEWIEARAKTPI